MLREDMSKSQYRASTLDTDVARLAIENSKLKDEVRKVSSEAKEAKSSFIMN